MLHHEAQTSREIVLDGVIDVLGMAQSLAVLFLQLSLDEANWINCPTELDRHPLLVVAVRVHLHVMVVEG